jgi:hypothetical protein
MKEIEKYVGYYLLVYLVVLAICGFFQYMSVCQGKSLTCAFSMSGINTIITTTAYVLTPIVAIIGFLSWKKQFNSQLISNLAQTCLNNLNKNFNNHSTLISFLHKYNSDLELISSDKKLEINILDLKKDSVLISTLITRLSHITNDIELEMANSCWACDCIFFISQIDIANAQENLNKVLISLNKTNDFNYRDIDIIPAFEKLFQSQKRLTILLSKYILV